MQKLSARYEENGDTAHCEVSLFVPHLPTRKVTSEEIIENFFFAN